MGQVVLFFVALAGGAGVFPEHGNMCGHDPVVRAAECLVVLSKR